jgi:hypothetical protein
MKGDPIRAFLISVTVSVILVVCIASLAARFFGRNKDE